MLFDDAEQPLVDSWTPESLLTEVMLIQGFPLDSTVTLQMESKDNTVQVIESNTSVHRLFICLDKNIADDTIKELEVNPSWIY